MGKQVELNAIGEMCPIPVVRARKALENLDVVDSLYVLVDNEMAVKNLEKMAKYLGKTCEFQQLEAKKYAVVIAGDGAVVAELKKEEEISKIPIVVAISSETMGSGDDQLGKALMKSFIYALSHQEKLPEKILFYNGGVTWTTKEVDALEDLKAMEAEGVEILSCGTCLDFYHLGDQLKVGGVTNMYQIVEIMSSGRVVRP